MSTRNNIRFYTILRILQKYSDTENKLTTKDITNHMLNLNVCMDRIL